MMHDGSIINPFLRHLYSVVKWAGIEGSTIKRLYNDIILKTEVMIPSVSEQARIAEMLDGIDHLITLHQREHATGDNVRSAQRRQGPHNQINILIFQFMNNVKIRFLCGRHTGMAKSPGYTSN